MGTEATCTLRIGRKAWNGKALLETSEIVFRGETNERVAFDDVRSAVAEAGVLVLELVDGRTLGFELGERAAKWADKVRSPPTRMKKLGVVAGAAVATAGRLEDAFRSEMEGVATKSTIGDAAIVFLAAETREDLAKVGRLRATMRDDAALWIVYPKGQARIREADVLGAGRAAGLKDVKVVRFSETHTALRFVVPLVDRKR